LPALLSTGPLELRAAVSQPAVLAALAVARAMPTALRAKMQRVQATAAGLRVVLRDGLRIDVGSAEQLRAKVMSLEAVTGYYRAKHVKPTWVDVSLPDRPLAKPKLAPLP
jgi:hypothetical protein